MPEYAALRLRPCENRRWNATSTACVRTLPSGSACAAGRYPYAHVRKRTQQPVLLNRRTGEQRLRGKLVVQRRIRGTQRRQVADVKRVRDVSVVLGRERRVPRVRVVPVLRQAECPGGRSDRRCRSTCRHTPPRSPCCGRALSARPHATAAVARARDRGCRKLID